MTGKASRRRSGLTAVLATLMLVALIPGQVSAASRPITFGLVLGNSCFWGRASDSATVNYTWRDSNGALVLSGQDTADASGNWQADCAAGGRGMRPGDRVRASDGNSVRRFVVPVLTLNLNRVTDIIRGRAPAGTQVEIEYLYPPGPVPDAVVRTKIITVASDGTWKLRTRQRLYIIGGSGASLYWQSARGDSIFVGSRAPRMVVTIGRATFSGIGKVLTQATLTVRDGVTDAIKGRATANVDDRGNFRGLVRTAGGARLPIAVGDRITSNIAADAGLIVPDIEATGDAATETVSGLCHDSGKFAQHAHVLVYRNGFERGWATFNTAQDGAFIVDMTDVFPNSSVIKSGDRLLVRCQHGEGDYVEKWFAVP